MMLTGDNDGLDLGWMLEADGQRGRNIIMMSEGWQRRVVTVMEG